MIRKIKRKLKILLCLSILKRTLFNDSDFLLGRFTQHSIPMLLQFDFDKLKKITLGFVEKMKFSSSLFEYKYALSCHKSNIYSSVYAAMILSMYGEIDKLSNDQKKEWLDYFDAFQNSTDGLFYDKVLSNDIYNDSDWWGARHLAAHIITAYKVMGGRPKYQFRFLEKYYNVSFLKEWFDSQNWNAKSIYAADIDNKIMNIGVLLQYQRDFWGDARAGESIRFIQDYLIGKINPNTGMWGSCNLEDSNELSRMVQFAYHLFLLFFYDNIDLGYKEKIIDYTLKTQNIYGGFGVQLNSSACEDIDSIDILIRLVKQTGYKKEEIEIVLKRAFAWVLVNQNAGGGFVFSRNEPFIYGHKEMSSAKNESALFPTWFRTLTIAYLVNYLFSKDFKIIRCSGYVF